MTKLRTAYLLEYKDDYYRQVKIRFRHDARNAPPFSTWYRYTKNGDVYTFDDKDSSYSHWMPDAEKSLEDGVTHKIKIVTQPTDVKPLRLRSIKQILYGAERREYEQKGGDPPVYLVLLVTETPVKAHSDASADLVDVVQTTEHAYSVIESAHPQLQSILQALATEKQCRVIARRLITNLIGETAEEFCFDPQ